MRAYLNPSASWIFDHQFGQRQKGKDLFISYWRWILSFWIVRKLFDATWAASVFPTPRLHGRWLLLHVAPCFSLSLESQSTRRTYSDRKSLPSIVQEWMLLNMSPLELGGYWGRRSICIFVTHAPKCNKLNWVLEEDDYKEIIKSGCISCLKAASSSLRPTFFFSSSN